MDAANSSRNSALAIVLISLMGCGAQAPPSGSPPSGSPPSGSPSSGSPSSEAEAPSEDQQEVDVAEEEPLVIPPAPTACRAPEWRAIPPSPSLEPRVRGAEVIAVGNRLVALSRLDGQLRGEVWDSETNTWSRLVDWPRRAGYETGGVGPRRFHVVGDRLVAFWRIEGHLHGTFLDVARMRWTEVSRENAPTARQSGSVVSVGRYVLTYQYTDGRFSGARLDTVANRWSPIPPGGPQSRCRFLAAGARLVAWCHDGGHVYDAATNRWFRLPTEGGPDLSSYAGFVAATDEALLVWGNQECSVHSGAIWSFDEGRWITVPPTAGLRSCRNYADPYLFALTRDHLVHIAAPDPNVGGSLGGPAYVFDRANGTWSTIELRTIALPIALPDGRVLATVRQPNAPIVILPAQGIACPITPGEIPFLASPGLGLHHMIGNEVVFWGSHTQTGPRCMGDHRSRAPCVRRAPGQYPPRVDRGGVTIRF